VQTREPGGVLAELEAGLFRMEAGDHDDGEGEGRQRGGQRNPARGVGCLGIVLLGEDTKRKYRGDPDQRRVGR